MTNYLFIDNRSGEMFSVEVDTKKEAKKIARDYFPEPIYLREATEYEVEMLGIDTY